MAHQDLMKQGLKGLLNPETQFQEERNFGKKVYITAWIVEILAATIGLLTAGAMAWDAWRQEDTRDISVAINAILGALPFLVIAIIEPTKIPLAGGLYKTRIFGWKILIFCALILLTGVTFETMFMGLERNTTNITAKVTKFEQQLQKLSDEKEKFNEDLARIIENPESNRLKEVSDLIDRERTSLAEELEGIYRSQQDEIKPHNEAILRAREEIQRLSGNEADPNNAKIEALNNQIKDIADEIKTNQARLEKEITDLTQRQTTIRTVLLPKNLEDKQDKDRKAKAVFDQSVREAEKQRLEELESAKGFLNQIPANRQTEIQENYDAKLAQAESYFDQQNSENQRLYEANRSALNTDLESIKDKLSKLENDQTIDDLRAKKSNLEKERADLLSGITGLANTKINVLNEQIKSAQARIDKINTQAAARVERAQKISDGKIGQYEAQRVTTTSAVSGETAKIPELKNKINDTQNKIEEAKDQKRTEAQKSQVYRLSAMYYGVDDVADVSQEQLKFVSSIWFGSIALIISTIGTVLALISHILRDPVAFEKKKKISVTRRAQRVLLVVGGRFAQMLAAIGKLIFEITKAIVAIAEIFRGLIGRPLQRSIRLCAVAIRKRMNKPKIIEKEIEVEVEKIVEKEIEVEVEKIVEKEVQVEVEVERIVEKIVEKEVPVDKIVIKEVPKEIIRKELVYVPLYSTDSGLIDSTKETLSMNPFRPTPVDPVEINREQNENIGAESKDTESGSAQESPKPKRARNTRRRNNSDKTE